MDSNASHKYLGRYFTKTTRVMPNIGFTASPDSTKITPDNIGKTIDKLNHDFPTICCVWLNKTSLE